MPEDRADPKGLEALIKKGDVDTVLTVFPDGLGRLMGKRVVGRYFLDHVLARRRPRLHLPLHGGHGDGAAARLQAHLVGARLRRHEAGARPRHAGGCSRGCRRPRSSSATSTPRRASPSRSRPAGCSGGRSSGRRSSGYRVKTASELELYLFRESFDEARAKRYHGLTPVSNYLEDYHILQTSKEEPLVRAIRNGMEAARVPVEFSKGEWGRGQEEINLRYAEALEMADRHVLYKHGVKEIAWQQGCSVTFMAKYDMGAAGSSFHLHSSLWDQAGQKNLFAAKGGSREGTPLFRHWLAGQMAMARELAYFYAPTVNAYKRYQAGSFAPTRIALGLGQPHLRLPALRRGRGLPGGEPHPGRRRQPVPRLRGDHRGRAPRHREEARAARPVTRATPTRTPTLPQVPKTLREALAELERSEVARAAFGPKVVEHYLHTAGSSSRPSTSPSPTGS